MRSIENCKAAMDYLEGQRNVAGKFKVKISRARKYKSLMCPKEMSHVLRKSLMS